MKPRTIINNCSSDSNNVFIDRRPAAFRVPFSDRLFGLYDREAYAAQQPYYGGIDSIDHQRLHSAPDIVEATDCVGWTRPKEWHRSKNHPQNAARIKRDEQGNEVALASRAKKRKKRSKNEDNSRKDIKNARSKTSKTGNEKQRRITGNNHGSRNKKKRSKKEIDEDEEEDDEESMELEDDDTVDDCASGDNEEDVASELGEHEDKEGSAVESEVDYGKKIEVNKSLPFNDFFALLSGLDNDDETDWDETDSKGFVRKRSDFNVPKYGNAAIYIGQEFKVMEAFKKHANFVFPDGKIMERGKIASVLAKKIDRGETSSSSDEVLYFTYYDLDKHRHPPPTGSSDWKYVKCEDFLTINVKKKMVKWTADKDVTGVRLIGRRVCIQWSNDKFYRGTITNYKSSNNSYQVSFDDGDEKEYKENKIFNSLRVD